MAVAARIGAAGNVVIEASAIVDLADVAGLPAVLFLLVRASGRIHDHSAGFRMSVGTGICLDIDVIILVGIAKMIDKVIVFLAVIKIRLDSGNDQEAREEDC